MLRSRAVAGGQSVKPVGRSSSSPAQIGQIPAAKILVADDDEGVRVGLVANLELEGYEVAEARDGAEAIKLIRANSYDLIVSDVVMPSATGVEVLSAVRQQHLDTPFILISAFVSEDLVTRALGDGLFAMLYKPFAMDRILEVVARALKRNVVLIVDDTHAYVSSLAEALRSVGHARRNPRRRPERRRVCAQQRRGRVRARFGDAAAGWARDLRAIAGGQ